MNRQRPPIEDADRERGAILFLKARSSRHSGAAGELDRWARGDVDRQSLIETLSRVWDGMGAISNVPAVERWRADANAKAVRSAWATRRRFALAASILLTVGLGFVLARTISPGSAAETEYATSIGERKELRLADGSFLSLDARSRVAVSFDSGERVARLLQGQARFRVAHDPHRPFHVEVAGEDVRALGTDFNIATEGRRLAISLISGAVLISRIEERSTLFGLARIAERTPIVTLKPGEQFERNAQGRLHVRRFDPQVVNAWQNGRLVFDSLPLFEAVALVNRYSRRQIVLDPALPAVEMSGVFNAGDGLPFAEAATSYLPGAFLQASATRLVISKRQQASLAAR